MLITVIIASFNARNTLEQCLESVFAQSLSNIETIVIDAGSTDGTVDIIKKNQNLINFWSSEPDTGVYNAWNKGLLHANGDWVCFLGADDFFWDEHVVEKSVTHLTDLPQNFRIAYGRVMLLGRADQPLHTIGETWKSVKTRFASLMSIPHPGTMHRRSLFVEMGSFDESYRIAGDYEFLLRELKTHDAYFIEDVIMVGMRHGGLSSNPANTLEALREVRRAQKKYGQILPRGIWCLAVIKVYIRLIVLKIFGETYSKFLLDLGRKIIGLKPIWTKI